MAKWVIRSKKADFEALSEKYGISRILARIMVNRGISEADFGMYLNDGLHDARSVGESRYLKDIEKAAAILRQKAAEGKKIRIVGDYDTDGVCASVILYKSIKLIGGDVDYCIPDRVNDGYGINISIVGKAIEDNVDTIITCDNGIMAFDAASYAKKNGMTFIITDHHEVAYEKIGEERCVRIPVADAVVDPKQADCGYPFKELCGAAVALKLSEALGIEGNDELLMFAAIATIGDIMELTGENRIIVKRGLDILKNTGNAGMNALIDRIGIDKKNIDAYHVGFMIGPCINAGGRLMTAGLAAELLLSDNAEEAAGMADELVRLNEMRKEMTEKNVSEALEIAERSTCAILLIYLKNCHESIAGIVAGRVRERVYKPVFIFTDSCGLIKGSGRSVEEYDMFAALSANAGLILKFGGHRMAAGLTLQDLSVLGELEKRLDDDIKKSGVIFEEKIRLDMILPFSYITHALTDELKKLAPFGKGNESPLFGAKNVRMDRLCIIGKNRNVLRLELCDEWNVRMEAVMFNNADKFLSYLSAKYGISEVDRAKKGMENAMRASFAFYPAVNTYNNEDMLQIIIKYYMED